MKEIDYLAFKKLLHIQDDDHWLGHEFPFLYRIAGGAVRAVPWGMKVDITSREPLQPLIRDLHHNPAQFQSLDGEADELELYNPSGVPDAVLFQFPAAVDVVEDFLTKADLWWVVDRELWQEYGLSESLATESDRQKEERHSNELMESSRHKDVLLQQQLRQDRDQFIRDMAEANAAALLRAQEQREAVPMGRVSAAPQRECSVPRRQRKDCLRDAMEAAFVVLESELKRLPNDSEMWGYLTKRDTSGYITGSSHDLILWRDWEGKRQTANKRNISDRLGRLRKSRNG